MGLTALTGSSPSGRRRLPRQVGDGSAGHVYISTMRTTQRLRPGWRDRPITTRDSVLALVLTAVCQAELLIAAAEVAGSRVLQHLAFAVITGAVALRRRRPLLGAGLVGAGLAGQTVIGDAPVAGGFVAVLIVTYSVATYCASRRDAALGLLAILVSIAVYPFVNDDVKVADEVVNAMIPTVVFVLARVAKERLDSAVMLERQRQLERHDEQRRREQALTDERRRIARELHDTVAHGVTLMLLQTEVLRGEPGLTPSAGEAVDVVQDAGRTCLDDLRRLLLVLREAGDGPGLGCAGTRELPALVEASRAAGTTVHLLEPDPRPLLPPSLDITVFRVVQEALTNAVRHAPSATVDVAWRWKDGRIEVRVTDDGPRLPLQRCVRGSGYGLVGARERAFLHEGTLQAGPRDAGTGWQVVASFPLAAAAT